MFTPQILSLVYSCKYYILVASTLQVVPVPNKNFSPKKKKKKRKKKEKRGSTCLETKKKQSDTKFVALLISGTSVRSEPPFFIWSISVSRSSSWTIVHLYCYLSLSLSLSVFILFFECNCEAVPCSNSQPHNT